MGVLYSIFFQSTPSVAPVTTSTKITTTTTTTTKAKEERADSVRQVEEQALHSSYLQYPICSNTIQAAKEYNLPSYEDDNDDDNNNDDDNDDDDDNTALMNPPSPVVVVAASSSSTSSNNNNRNKKVYKNKKKTLMPGTHKHLGGAYDPFDGCIYGVPASAKSVLVLYPKLKNTTTTTTTTNEEEEDDYRHPNNLYSPQQLKFNLTENHHFDPSLIEYGMTCIPLPASIASTKFKWLRGIFSNGYMYAIPAWANAILCVNVDAFWGRRQLNQGEDIVTLIPLPTGHTVGQWQWHGAGMNQEKTAIYCIPSNAQHVLKVDLLTKTASLLDIQVDMEQYPNFRMDLSNKWYGGILGTDNAVYGIPYRSCAVLRIDCHHDLVTLVGPDFGCNGYNWHGGIIVGGKIYAHPSHADYTVLCIDTNQRGLCTLLPIQRAADDNNIRSNYKWLGGSLGADGNIYCPACDVSACLKINVTTDICTTFGNAGDLKNKWQGGVLGKDGCVYCIPASGLHVLRIATMPGLTTENPIQLLGNLPKHKDKWQGGHVGLDGNIYFIPENGYRVLRVKTPQTFPTLTTPDGQLPIGDVKVEMM